VNRSRHTQIFKEEKQIHANIQSREANMYSGRHKYSARNKYSVMAFFNKFLPPKKIFLTFFFFYPLDWSILYKKSKEKIEKYFS
jgi:hypothetical protein